MYSRLSLFYILFATFAATSVHGLDQPKKINVGRFDLRGESAGNAPVPSTASAAEAAAYAKWLTSRKPTRRSTAQRRQASEDARIVQENTIFATDYDNGETYGNLVFGAGGWKFSTDDTPSLITYSASGLYARSSREAQRLSYTPADSSDPYKVFAVGQCYAGGPKTLTKGSSNVLCLVNSAAPTRPGAVPTKAGTSLDHSGSSYVESDIWTIDYSQKTATPTWINPDGKAVEAHVIVAVGHPDIVFVTADVDATSAAFGLEFRKVTLTFSAKSKHY